jgi:hypothetical protein
MMRSRDISRFFAFDWTLAPRPRLSSKTHKFAKYNVR